MSPIVVSLLLLMVSEDLAVEEQVCNYIPKPNPDYCWLMFHHLRVLL